MAPVTKPSESVVRAEAVGARYGADAWGVRGVSMDLHPGSFVALIGANGAGKTTLIHLICGVLATTEGHVDRRVQPSQLGWCSQHQVIDWFMSVRDNVMLGARLAGFARRDL